MNVLRSHGLALLFALPLVACTSGDGDASATTCKVAIVGAGAAGLHTAYRLAPKFGEGVCVFEKETRVGGRLYDIGKTPEDEAAGLVVGNGGRRIEKGQDVLFGLADELGIVYDTPKTGADIVFARGRYATDKDEFVDLYPGLVYDDTKPDVEGQLLDKLVNGPERAKIASYPSFLDYAKAAVGDAGVDFLHDMSRFRGDYELPLDARSYVDFLEEDLTIGPDTSYPKGGLAMFPKRLAEESEAAGARIFLGEPVASIDKAGDAYALRTSERAVEAEYVVLTATPHAVEKIGGAVTEQLRATEPYQSILGVRVTVINQWFATPWWRDLKTKDGRGLWRAYTTSDATKDDGRCINYVEIPPEKWVAESDAPGAYVIRAVYNDQPACAEMWAKLHDAKDDAKRDELLHAGLTLLFAANGISTPVTVPPAVKTTFWEWPDGWHFLRSGAKLTNAELMDWAVEPLPGERISFVGEAYNVQRTTWSDGAYKSSKHYLKKTFGIE